MKITFVIVVTYNGINWIEKCLQSIRQCIHYGTLTHIIVIDNCSTDSTCEFIKNNFPEIVLVQNSENIGFGGANNVGIKLALDKSADYVFLLNQDAWIEDMAIDKLINVAEQNKEYGIISPLHLNGVGDKLDSGFRKYLNTYCPNLLEDLLLANIMKSIYPINFVNAAAWLISRSTIERIGLFDKTFFHYGEDDNYVHRCHFYNLKVGIVPNVKIFHDREARKSQKNKKSIHFFQRSKLVYYCNINILNGNEMLLKEITTYRIKILKNICLFKSNAFKKNLAELRILTKMKSLVFNSRMQNTEGVLNYFE